MAAVGLGLPALAQQQKNYQALPLISRLEW